MTRYIVTCRSPRRNALTDGELCDGFVARVPWPFVVVGLLRHSDKARADTLVAPCVACGSLHEIRCNVIDRATVSGVS